MPCHSCSNLPGLVRAFFIVGVRLNWCEKLLWPTSWSRHALLTSWLKKLIAFKVSGVIFFLTSGLCFKLFSIMALNIRPPTCITPMLWRNLEWVAPGKTKDNISFWQIYLSRWNRGWSIMSTSWLRRGMPPWIGSMISFLWIPSRSSMFRIN